MKKENGDIEKHNSEDFLFEDSRKGFTKICNFILQNTREDAFAAHIWSYLQSLPHGWKVNREQLKKHFYMGEDKYRKHMTYLKEKRLIEIKKEKGAGGQFVKSRIIVKNGSNFIPDEDRLDENNFTTRVVKSNPGSRVVKSSAGKHPPLYTDIDIQRNIDINKKETTTNMDMVDLKHNDQPEPSRPVVGFYSSISKQADDIDLFGLQKHGIDKNAVMKLLRDKIEPSVIQRSLISYAAFLQVTANALKVNSKAGYFMKIMKDHGSYGDGTNTEADVQMKVDIEEIKKSILAKLSDLEKQDVFNRELHKFYRKTREQNESDCLNDYAERIAKARLSKERYA